MLKNSCPVVLHDCFNIHYDTFRFYKYPLLLSLASEHKMKD